MNVDGQTRLVGVMGWPVEHSLSPAMHNAALAALGYNWAYVPLPVAPDDVAGAVRGAAALGFRGFNVTVPHKQAVMALMDDVTPEATAVGAVNTVVIDHNGGDGPTFSGHNTDVAGFLGALREGGFEPGDGGKAVIVGAGGAARAVAYGLLVAGMDRVAVLNRTVRRAEALVADLIAVTADGGVGTPVAAELSATSLPAEVEDATLLVNATTLGMWPQVDGTIWPAAVPFPSHLTVYDLVYNPLETALLRRAREAGARPIDGLGMLARQGALALDIWLDRPLDLTATALEMRRVCEAALQH